MELERLRQNAGDSFSLKKDNISQAIIPPEGKDFDALEIDGNRVEFGQTAKPLTIKNAQGKVTCKIVKKGTNSKIYKKIKINKKGVITFKKGKYAKKTYKIKVKITAAGNSKYNKKTITKTVKVKIK